MANAKGIQARIDQMGVASSEYQQQRTVRRDDEHQEQVALVRHIETRLRPGVFWCAIPNGGHRNARTGARLKAEGVRAGVPDLHFLVPVGKGAMALYLEYKTKAGRLSKSQQAIGGEIEASGGVFKVAYGVDEALAILEQLGVIWPATHVYAQGE